MAGTSLRRARTRATSRSATPKQSARRTVSQPHTVIARSETPAKLQLSPERDKTCVFSCWRHALLSQCVTCIAETGGLAGTTYDPLGNNSGRVY
eukprot:620831-Rhodomonas_salina.1